MATFNTQKNKDLQSIGQPAIRSVGQPAQRRAPVSSNNAINPTASIPETTQAPTSRPQGVNESNSQLADRLIQERNISIPDQEPELPVSSFSAPTGSFESADTTSARNAQENILIHYGHQTKTKSIEIR